MAISFQLLPELPVGIKHGVGGIIGQKLYAGLGSSGNAFFVLDLKDMNSGWKSAADFPGIARNDAAYTVCGNKLYVFSGAGIEGNNSFPTVLMDGYVFDSQINQWTRLERTLPTGFLGASCCSLSSTDIIFFGGYDKDTFNNFLSEISKIDVTREPNRYKELITIFMSQPIDNYNWNRNIWSFIPCNEHWSVVGENPFKPNCGSGIIHKDNVVTLIEGEVKPGLRSLETKRYLFKEGKLEYSDSCASIIDISENHEGLAGHFFGEIDNKVIVIGGAYFIGSQDAFINGSLYAHNGLIKHFSSNVWIFDGKSWENKYQLDAGIAYGVSASNGKAMYILGGENSNGDAMTRCLSLLMD
ncbi:YjhT family mutarotase [Vibrio cholerae]|nr:YjhT family mutarotase [Vibrio cholerae]EJK2097832.1 YjhT family mutarotase [Vibrio cholerae]EKF9606575.1 YjhT family mutarotase [Vibrio cholerae]